MWVWSGARWAALALAILLVPWGWRRTRLRAGGGRAGGRERHELDAEPRVVAPSAVTTGSPSGPPAPRGDGKGRHAVAVAAATIMAVLVGTGAFFGVLFLTAADGEQPTLSAAPLRSPPPAAEPSETAAADVSRGPGLDAGEQTVLVVEAPAAPLSRTALARSLEPPGWVSAFRGPPESVSDALAGTLLPLRDQLRSTIEEIGWEAGVAVIDLRTGEQFAVNGDTQFQAASTIKFFVTLSMLRDIDQGLYDTSVVEKDLYDVMVFQSNEAARTLTRLAGIRTVNANLQTWGLTNTIITHPSDYIEEAHPAYDPPSNLTTPADAARGLALLYRGQIVAPELSRWLVDRLTNFPRREGIRGAIPLASGRVFYKVGWLGDDEYSVVHDMGIVEFERGDDTLAFALAIYTQGARPQSPAWTFVRETAGSVWEYFSTVRYPPLDEVGGAADAPADAGALAARSR